MTGRQNGDWTRRRALGAGLGAFGLTALGPLKAASPRRWRGRRLPDKNFLVVVELEGGNDGLNTIVPQDMPSYFVQRPTLGLTGGDTLALDSGPGSTTAYRMHPSLTNLAQLYLDGELAIIPKVGYPESNGSHEVSKRVWAYGRREFGNRPDGWIARYAGLEAPTPLGAVSIRRGRHPSMVSPNSKPLTMGYLDDFEYEEDGSHRSNHGRRLEIVREMLARRAAGDTRDALQTGHDLADSLADAVSSYSSSVSYGSGRLSRATQNIAMMVQAGFDTRVYYTGTGGFDTHGGQGGVTGRHANLLSGVDRGVGDLVADLKAMGAWNKAVIVIMSEFGRRNFENGSGGTDHGRANFVMVTGGAVRGGLHGPELTDDDVAQNNVDYALDYRRIYTNLLEAHLGMEDTSQVFDETLEIPRGVNLVY